MKLQIKNKNFGLRIVECGLFLVFIYLILPSAFSERGILIGIGIISFLILNGGKIGIKEFTHPTTKSEKIFRNFVIIFFSIIGLVAILSSL